MKNVLILRGCAPEPLLHYLKALGILRLVAEQLDPHARGAWHNDEFVLETSKTDAQLIDFFLNNYRPTPIVAPWNGGSGFYAKDKSQKERHDKLLRTDSPRFEAYRETVTIARQIVGARDNAPKEEEKASLLRACRREFPEAAVEWLDAAFTLGDEKPGYPPLMGTGGNDGRLEFTTNFVARLISIFHLDGDAKKAAKQRVECAGQLRSALFGEGGVSLEAAVVGQFHPGGIGGPNATEGPEGDSLVNPWDYILSIEGALFFASATVRQLNAWGKQRASFPFTVDGSQIGYGTVAGEEVRAEMWLPLWERPATFFETRHIFSEGRARLEGPSEKGGKVRTGFDFARAIASFGVDRGIDAFVRFSFIVRNGKAYLAPAIGRFDVRTRPLVSFVNDFDQWLRGLQRATANESHTPPRFIRARKNIEEAVFGLCASNEVNQFDCLREILISLGEAETEAAVSPRFRGEHNLQPLALHNPDWGFHCGRDLNEADRSDFEIAVALASINNSRHSLPFRINLEPVEFKGRATWSSNDSRVVWGNGTFEENLAATLHRRSVDARSGGDPFPAITGARVASLTAISRFLTRKTDDEKIEQYLRGLMLLSKFNGVASDESTAFLPDEPVLDDYPFSRVYALLKLLFLPEGTIVFNREEKVIRPEPRVAPLLRAGRTVEAAEIAINRLRAAGLVPKFKSEDLGEEDGPRLAAALLIPISGKDARQLANLVLRQPTPKN